MYFADNLLDKPTAVAEMKRATGTEDEDAAQSTVKDGDEPKMKHIHIY